MTPLALTLTALLFAADPPADAATRPMRKPHPLAPSLNQLTSEEEDKLDDVINRFIRADAGMSKSDEAKQAQRDFDALGRDAIPALIRGLNRAAQLDHSCPTLMIAKKLSRMLAASDDQKLLEFGAMRLAPVNARQTRRRFGGVAHAMSDTQELPRPLHAAADHYHRSANPAQDAAHSDDRRVDCSGTRARRHRTQDTLGRTGPCKGPEVLLGFSTIIQGNDLETQQYVRGLMDKYLAKQTNAFIKEKLKDKDVEVRRAALRAAAKSAAFIPNLIDALGDDQAEVREESHQGLLKWRKGEDFGPAADADKQQIQDAQAKWRAWVVKTLYALIRFRMFALAAQRFQAGFHFRLIWFVQQGLLIQIHRLVRTLHRSR